MAHRTQSDETSRETGDEAGAGRQRRYGRLPERIRPQDTVETKPATLPDPARDTYHADEWLIRYCG